MEIDYQLLQDFVNRKTFVTRGFIPMTKKMWRDGYNKALFDFLTFIHMNTVPGGTAEKDVYKGSDPSES